MAVIDVISYNGEADMLELRLNLLGEHVDQFIIVEGVSTFSAQPKESLFKSQEHRFLKWASKIKYCILEDNYSQEEIESARASKYTSGQFRWMHEFLQKESIKKFMVHLKDDDVCYIGDVDEIWEPRQPKGIEKLKLRVYTYYLNFRSTEEFWGPIRCRYKDIKNECFNNVRNNTDFRTSDYQGWHFTNQGGYEAVKKKVFDNYDGVTFNGEFFKYKLDERYGVTDYLGRDFKFWVDESDWPPWLKEHREDYKKLLK